MAHLPQPCLLVVEDGWVVGMCSIIQGPDSRGMIEIGYGVAPSWRGKGAARRAVAELLNWARQHPDIAAVSARTLPDNIASQGVLIGNLFVQTGEVIDPEDGELLCWEIPTGPD